MGKLVVSLDQSVLRKRAVANFRLWDCLDADDFTKTALPVLCPVIREKRIAKPAFYFNYRSFWLLPVEREIGK
jgi:hypothetical protein